MRHAAMLVCLAFVLSATTSVAAASPYGLLAPADDPLVYCDEGLDAGAAGAHTDAEHDVRLPDEPLPAGVTQARLTVDGVGTRVLQAGPATAEEAVVFVHGNPDSARDFDALLVRAGRFGRAVAFDMPGYGRADDRPGLDYSTTGAARFIARALELLGDRARPPRHARLRRDLGSAMGHHAPDRAAQRDAARRRGARRRRGPSDGPDVLHSRRGRGVHGGHEPGGVQDPDRRAEPAPRALPRPLVRRLRPGDALRDPALLPLGRGSRRARAPPGRAPAAGRRARARRVGRARPVRPGRRRGATAAGLSPRAHRDPRRHRPLAAGRGGAADRAARRGLPRRARRGAATAGPSAARATGRPPAVGAPERRGGGADAGRAARAHARWTGRRTAPARTVDGVARRVAIALRRPLRRGRYSLELRSTELATQRQVVRVR